MNSHESVRLTLLINPAPPIANDTSAPLPNWLNYPGKGIEIQMRFSHRFPAGAAAAQAQCNDRLNGKWTVG
jgi:hypothetical protein